MAKWIGKILVGRRSWELRDLRWAIPALLFFCLAVGIYAETLVSLHRGLHKRLYKLHRYQTLALKNQEVEKRHRYLANLYSMVIGSGTLRAETPYVASATLQDRLYKMVSAADASLNKFNLDKVEDLGSGIKHLLIRVSLSGPLGSIVDLLYALESNTSPLLVVDSLYIAAFSNSYARTSSHIRCALEIDAFYMETPK